MPVSNEEGTWTTPVFEVVSVVLERDDVYIFAGELSRDLWLVSNVVCTQSRDISSPLLICVEALARCPLRARALYNL